MRWSPALSRRHRGGGIRVVVNDPFTRADSAVSLGTSASGHAWTADVGTWGISSNKGYCPTPSGASPQLATVAAGVSDCTVSAALSGTGVGTGTVMPWLIARMVDSTNYLLVSAQTATTIELFRRVAGAFTQIGTASYAWAASQTVSVVCSGQNISVYVDGALLIAPVSEATFSTATRMGIGGPVTMDTSVRFDDFRVTVP